MIRSLAVLLVFAGVGVAAELPKLPNSTMALIDGARSVPPEFTADLLLRLADTPAVPQTVWKKQLIEEAFSEGAYAQLPYNKRGERTTDARASRAFWKNDLEALTLQSRAVDAMLPLDPHRARVFFEQIETPQVPALSCQEIGTPDLSVYYLSAAKVFAQGFSPAERDKREGLHLLENLIGHMQSPAHVTPVVRLIYTSPLSADDRRELVGVFAGVLGRVNGSQRVFGATTFQLVPVSAPVKLPPGINGAPPLLSSAAGELPQPVLDGAEILIPALRAYIVRHVTGARCREDIKQGEMPAVVKDFSYFVSKLDPSGTLYNPITIRESEPAKDGGTYPSHWWWKSDRSKQVLNALKWLNHGNRDLPDDQRFFTLEERKSVEWRSHYADTVKLIEGWSATEEESFEDWFGMVSESLELLAEKVPPGEQRQAIERYVNFMETHYASVESRNLWFTQWHGLWASQDSAIVDQLAASSNPVIALYAKVGRLAAK